MLREFHLENEDVYRKGLDDYWRAATGGVLRLATEGQCATFYGRDPQLVFSPDQPEFFCRQEFRGRHEAIRRKWWETNDNGTPVDQLNWVEPFVLCQPGSVFSLIADDATAGAEKLDALIANGLPVAIWRSLDDISVTWDPDHQDCPFIPGNGYGAIRVEDQR